MKKQMYISGGTLQNRLGFTLIELLAVIVILSIIALIATPIVLNIIKDSKDSATLQSAQFYIDAVEHSITKKIMDDPTFKPTSCEIQSDGNLKCNGTDVKVEINGEVPSSGTIILEKGKIKDVSLTLNDKSIVKQNSKLVYLKSGLYDAEGNLIATWDELVKDYGIDLEKDYMDENGQPIVDISELPGSILSQNEKLKQGTKLVIDSSIKKISGAAFAFCTSLKEIIIPNSVTTIGIQTFALCSNLEKITIPNSITIIGDKTFYGCTSLKEVTIPNSVISIDIFAFQGCTSLTKVTIGNGVTSIGTYAFRNCTSLKEIVIPDSVTSIGDYVFASCTSLKEIVIPDSVTSMGSSVLEGCTSLTKVTIGNSITNIEENVFNNCTNLSSITIGNGVTSIGPYAFKGCTNLTEITIPKSITSMGMRAFAETNLTIINYVGTQEQWNSMSRSGDWNENTPSNMVINYNYVVQ